jgi:hypothetical protein
MTPPANTTDERQHAPQPAPTARRNQPERPTPFFIVGTGRCGTTLLQAILSAHPRIASPPETLFFNRFDPAAHAADPLPDEETDRYLRRVADDNYFQLLGLDPERLARAVRKGARSARDLLFWFLTELTANDDPATLFAEKTPGHQRYVHRINAVFPDAKIVHIHRDPRDTVASLQRAQFINRSTTTDYARYYRRVVERQFRWHDTLGPHRHFTVRYESLVDDLENQLRPLCDFLGVEPHPDMLAHHDAERSTPLYLDFEKSWKDPVKEAVNTSRIGRYRTQLTDRDIAAVERTLGRRLMQQLSYTHDPHIQRKARWAAADAANEARLRLARAARRALGMNPRND